jgi:uncharacterized protein YkwD
MKPELRLQFDRLREYGEKCGVPWDDAAISAQYRGTAVQFDRLLDSNDNKEKQEATRIMTVWAQLIKAKKEALNKDRGVSPKSAAPPKTNKVVEMSASEKIGLTAEEQQVVLRAHNVIRKGFGAAPLENDERLEAHAQHWANHLAQEFAAGRQILVHNLNNRKVDGLNGNTGENLAYKAGSGSEPSFTHEWPVRDWASEVKDYDLKAKTPKPDAGMTGHFTQVVWKATTRVGCGFVLFKMPDGWWHAIWVCNYHPAGNVIGHHAANVGEFSRPVK